MLQDHEPNGQWLAGHRARRQRIQGDNSPASGKDRNGEDKRQQQG
jgi:hypothetical protein